MTTIVAPSIKSPSLKQTPNTVRQPRATIRRPRPTFLTALLRTLSAFAA